MFFMNVLSPMRSLFLISGGKFFQSLLLSYRIDCCEADFLNKGIIKLLPVLNLVEIFLRVSKDKLK